jgi:hypothetical protein
MRVIPSAQFIITLELSPAKQRAIYSLRIHCYLLIKETPPSLTPNIHTDPRFDFYTEIPFDYSEALFLHHYRWQIQDGEVWQFSIHVLRAVCSGNFTAFVLHAKPLGPLFSHAGGLIWICKFPALCPAYCKYFKSASAATHSPSSATEWVSPTNLTLFMFKQRRSKS